MRLTNGGRRKFTSVSKGTAKCPKLFLFFPGIDIHSDMGFFRLSLRQTADRANTPLEWSRQKWQLACPSMAMPSDTLPAGGREGRLHRFPQPGATQPQTPECGARRLQKGCRPVSIPDGCTDGNAPISPVSDRQRWVYGRKGCRSTCARSARRCCPTR